MHDDMPQWLSHSIESEQALLGAILLQNEAMPLVSEFLRKEHFYEPIHAEIFEICERLIGAGKAANPLTIMTFLPNGTVVGDMTVKEYVARLARNATTVLNARDYAGNIRDLYLHRELIQIGAELMRPIPRDVNTFASEAIDAIDAVAAANHQLGERPVDLSQAVLQALDASARAYQNEGALLGLSWGLDGLNRKTLGMHPGDLIVIAGRPGMGKTAVALSIARHVAGPYDGNLHPGMIFSLEMGAVSLTHRMIADEMFNSSPLPYLSIRSGKFSEAEFDRMRDATDRLAALPIHIEQRGAMTVSQIAAKARRRKRTHGLQWLMIDYLQLIKVSDRYQGNRVQEVGEITSSLKQLAKELGIPIIILAQLNRGVETREDKRPTLSDLRESGNIEQDADLVMMLYRDAYYVERQQPKNARADSEEFASWGIRMTRARNKLDIIIEKQRQGPVGTVRVFCDIACNAVRDLEENEPEVV